MVMIIGDFPTVMVRRVKGSKRFRARRLDYKGNATRATVLGDMLPFPRPVGNEAVLVNNFVVKGYQLR